MSIEILINSKLNSQGLKDTEFQLLSVKQILKSMESIGPAELLKFDVDAFTPFAAQGVQAIEAQIEKLREYSATVREAAQGAKALGNEVASGAFQKREAELNKEIRSLESLVALERKAALEKKNSAQAEMEQQRATQSSLSTEQQAALMTEKYAQATRYSSEAIKAQIVQLRQREATLKNAALLEFGKGNTEQANVLQKLANEARNTANAYEQMTDSGKKTDFMTNIMNSSFNKFGFTLFVTISTVQQLIGMLSQMFAAAEEGAAVLDRFESFDQNLARVGIAAGDLGDRLKEAGQGAVKMDTAMQGVLRLLKADLPTMANQADVLLEIATNAAIVEGDISDLNRIYETLITGIIRGEPRLIDNAGIILKVGKSVEAYAASLGKTTEQLTESEKAQAVFNAVVAKGDVIAEMAENLDSTALTLQQFKTELSEAGDILKATWAEVLVLAINRGKEFKDILQGTGDDARVAGEALTGTAAAIEKVYGTLTGFVAAVGTGIVGITTLATGLNQTVLKTTIAFNELFRTIVNRYREALEAVRNGGNLFKEMFSFNRDVVSEVKDTISVPFESFNDAVSESQTAMSDFSEKFGLLPSQADDLTAALTPAEAELKNLSSQLDLISDKMETAFDPLSDANISKELSEKRLDIEDDYAEKMVDIRQKLSEKLADISNDLNDKLLEIAKDRKDSLLKITQDLVEAQTEINEELAEKLGEIESDSTEKTTKVREDAKEKILENEEDYQKKLNDIQRKYELARLNALIDRDARALFEAEQTRKEDLKDATETAEEKRNDITKELEKQIEEIQKEEEKSRADAVKSAEKRRRDAIEQYEKQRREAIEQYNKARREAQEAADKQRQDAIQASEKERRDANDAYKDKLDDLQKWHNDQLLKQKEAEVKRLLARAKEYEKEGKLTQDHINELSRMWNEYNNMAESGGTASPVSYNPGGGGSSSGGGSGGGGSTGGAVPGSGGLGQPELRFEGGRWVWVYPDGTRVPLGGQSSATPSSDFGTMSSQPQKVNITVNNDRTLEQIFKEMSYEAVVEVVK